MKSHAALLVALALATSTAVAIAPGAAAAEIRCHGLPATIVGGAAGEVIHGTAHADVIAGRGGSDTIYGLGGNDVICGGYAADRLYGGAGNDRLFGQHDRIVVVDDETDRIGDTLRGGPGDDRLVPGRDTRPADDISRDAIMWDTASRGVVIDIMTGVATGQGRDTFGAPNTWIIGSPFADHITGGPAGDHINGERGSDTIAGNRGNDVIVADASTPGGRGTHDEVRGGRGNDRISSSSGSDAIWGGDGNDFIDDFGGAPDTVYAGAGADTIVYDLAQPDAQHPLTLGGGTGHDRLSLFSNHLNPTPATTSASGTWNMATGHLVFTVSGDAIVAGAAGFEEGHLSTFGATWTVRGTTGDDLMSAGSVKATTFTALAGDDTFLGSAYDDTFDGGPGTDRSLGMGAGDDTCISVEAFDVADCEHVLP